MKYLYQRISFILLIFILGANSAYARFGSIIATTVHDGMGYNIISDGTATLFGNLAEYGGNPDFTGAYIIPEQIDYNGQKYIVDCINPAFQNISGLTAIVIPKTVTYISTSFSYCPALKQIIFEDGDQTCEIAISTYSNSTGSAVESIYIGRPITNATKYLMLGGSTLKEVVIGGNNKALTLSDFSDCPNLERVTIDCPVTWKGTYNYPSFNNCAKLKYVNFTERSKITALPAVFNKCTSLYGINLPSTITYIGDKAFYDAPQSAVLVCNASTPPEIRYFIFNNSNSIYVPAESVDAYKIGYWTQNYGLNIKSISLPDNISLNTATLSLKLGSTSLLKATDIASHYLLSWSSSNPEVATVFNGMITAISPGECDITVTYNSIITATCHVVVENTITNLKISEESLDLDVNETATLRIITTPSSIPGLDINWESSDPDVVSVDNGHVTALNPGTATITASVNSGNTQLSVSSKVTVSSKYYTLFLRIPEGSYAIKDLTDPFTFSVVPDDGWEISSASFDDKEVEIDIKDPYTFTTPDELIDHTFTVVLKKQQSTSTQDLALQQQVKLIVKPKGLAIKGYRNGDYVRIYDVKGMCLFEGQTDYIPFDLKGCFILTVGKEIFKFIR